MEFHQSPPTDNFDNPLPHASGTPKILINFCEKMRCMVNID